MSKTRVETCLFGVAITTGLAISLGIGNIIGVSWRGAERLRTDMRENQTAVRRQLGGLRENITQNGTMLAIHAERLDAVEERLDALEERLDALEERVDSLAREVAVLRGNPPGSDGAAPMLREPPGGR